MDFFNKAKKAAQEAAANVSATVNDHLDERRRKKEGVMHPSPSLSVASCAPEPQLECSMQRHGVSRCFEKFQEEKNTPGSNSSHSRSGQISSSQ